MNKIKKYKNKNKKICSLGSGDYVYKSYISRFSKSLSIKNGRNSNGYYFSEQICAPPI
jgi:hypothetical protein